MTTLAPTFTHLAFQPFSATWISSTTGYVLGGARCTRWDDLCYAELRRTDDRGATWRSVHIPALTVGGYRADLDGVRFADADDGYLFGRHLWTTHDGGAHWGRAQLVAGRQDCADVEALEIGTGVVHLVTLGACGRYGVHFVLETSGLHGDHFVAARVSLPVGAGGGGGPQLFVRGARAWLLDVNRGLVGAARYVDGAWRPWPQAPCAVAKGNGYPDLTVDVGGSELAADCFEYAGPTAGATVHVVSTDGGASFHAGTNDFGTKKQLDALDTASGSSAEYDVEFTTPTQGFAIVGVEPDERRALFLTTDAGRTWRRVLFAA